MDKGLVTFKKVPQLAQLLAQVVQSWYDVRIRGLVPSTLERVIRTGGHRLIRHGENLQSLEGPVYSWEQLVWPVLRGNKLMRVMLTRSSKTLREAFKIGTAAM